MEETQTRRSSLSLCVVVVVSIQTYKLPKLGSSFLLTLLVLLRACTARAIAHVRVFEARSLKEVNVEGSKRWRHVGMERASCDRCSLFRYKARLLYPVM